MKKQLTTQKQILEEINRRMLQSFISKNVCICDDNLSEANIEDNHLFCLFELKSRILNEDLNYSEEERQLRYKARKITEFKDFTHKEKKE